MQCAKNWGCLRLLHLNKLAVDSWRSCEKINVTKTEFYSILDKCDPPFTLCSRVAESGWLYRFCAEIKCRAKLRAGEKFRTCKGKPCGTRCPNEFVVAEFFGAANVGDPRNAKAEERQAKAFVKYKRWLDEYSNNK